MLGCQDSFCWTDKVSSSPLASTNLPLPSSAFGSDQKKHQPLSLLALVVVVTILNTQFHQIQMCNIILIYFCSLCWELGDPLLFRNVLPSCLSCNNANMNMTFQMSLSNAMFWHGQMWLFWHQSSHELSTQRNIKYQKQIHCHQKGQFIYEGSNNWPTLYECMRSEQTNATSQQNSY